MNASNYYSSSYFAPTVSHYRAVTAMLGFVRELAADVQYSWNCATDGQPDWSVYVSFVVRPVCLDEEHPGRFFPITHKQAISHPERVAMWTVYGLLPCGEYELLHGCDCRPEAESRAMIALQFIQTKH